MKLNIPQIDERSEAALVRQCERVVFDRSQRQLNDFSPNNPLGVLIRAQAFAGAELLYAVNKLPNVLLLTLLSQLGIERIESTRAQADIVVRLTQPRQIPYSLPAGTAFTTINGRNVFLSESALVIPAGQIEGTVSAAATVSGSAGNVAAFTIGRLQQPLTFVASVSNPAAAQGGSDGETEQQAIERGISALRSRAPISAIDYEIAARDILGPGGRAKAIGLLDGNFRTDALGAVHVFCLAPDGTPANPALIADVTAALLPRIMLGSSLYVSPMGIRNVSATLILRALPEQNVSTLADRLYEEFQAYTSAPSYEPGDSLLIDELRYSLRSVEGVERIDEILLNELNQDVPMPNQWTIPNAFSMAIAIYDSEGNLFEALRGAGESEDFNP